MARTDGNQVDITEVRGEDVPVVGGQPALPVVPIDSSGNPISIPVVTDDSAQVATPEFINVGGEYRATPTTYADGDATILQTDQNGKLKVAGQGSSGFSLPGLIVGSQSGTGSYTFDASAQTITFSGLPTLGVEDIGVIVNLTDNVVIYNPQDNALGGTISSNVLTLTFDTTSMSDTDELQIPVAFNNSQDYNLNVTKTIDQSPTWSRYTDQEELISSAQTLTTSFADLGPEIDMRGYNKLGLWITVDINDASDVELRILHKHTLAGSEEYREIYLGSPSGNITTINLNDYQVASDADQLFKFVVDVDGTSPYVQIQARMKTDGGVDADIDAAYITKSYS